MNEPKSLPQLTARLALRPKEAAEALGISERTFRSLLPELPHIRRGGVVLVPIRAVEQWLSDEAVKEMRSTAKLADEIARSLQDDFE